MSDGFVNSENRLKQFIPIEPRILVSRSDLEDKTGAYIIYAVGMKPYDGSFKLKKELVKNNAVVSSEFFEASHNDVLKYFEMSLYQSQSKKESVEKKLKKIIKSASLSKISESLMLSYFMSNKSPITKQSPVDLIILMQEALIKNGFNLPKSGADGIIGGETISAINNFKKSIGKSEDGLIYPDDLKILLGEKTPSNNEQKMETKTSGSILYFGDSQMGGGVGHALKTLFGEGKVLYQNGSKPSAWLSNNSLRHELNKKPSQIVINLGGNGIDGAESLLELIKKITPNSKIAWFGGPPAILRPGSSYSVKTRDQVSSLNKRRNGNNEQVASLVQRYGGTFINPFGFFEADKIENGTAYSCNKCDGIHMPKEVAMNYYAATAIATPSSDVVADVN
jgi:peptidoglycan hydrolase-like protein with peptidoglycan-binding domain